MGDSSHQKAGTPRKIPRPGRNERGSGQGMKPKDPDGESTHQVETLAGLGTEAEGPVSP